MVGGTSCGPVISRQYAFTGRAHRAEVRGREQLKQLMARTTHTSVRLALPTSSVKHAKGVALPVSGIQTNSMHITRTTGMKPIVWLMEWYNRICCGCVVLVRYRLSFTSVSSLWSIVKR